MSTLATLFFDMSTARDCANIPITDDNVTESPEEFCVVLYPEDGDPEDPGNPKTTVTIVDDDAVTIGFEMEVYTTREDQDSVQVCALIREGALAREVIITVLTEDDTAQSLEDYTSVSAMLSFNQDSSVNCLNISLTNDDTLENVEQFVALLESEDSVPVVLSPERAVVMIIDDDGEFLNVLHFIVSLLYLR